MAKRSAPEINAGSMADIAFLLLIFFLVTTTMNVDSGIMRTLPPMQEENQPEEQVKIKRRNLMFVSVNKQDKILLNLTEQIDITSLKDRAKEFILNTKNDANLPEVVIENIEGLGNVRVSKATISLQNARETSYDIYVKVQNELTRAYNEIRDEYSMRYYSRPFAELNKEESKAIRNAVKVRISEAEPKF